MLFLTKMGIPRKKVNHVCEKKQNRFFTSRSSFIKIFSCSSCNRSNMTFLKMIRWMRQFYFVTASISTAGIKKKWMASFAFCKSLAQIEMAFVWISCIKKQTISNRMNNFFYVGVSLFLESILKNIWRTQNFCTRYRPKIHRSNFIMYPKASNATISAQSSISSSLAVFAR